MARVGSGFGSSIQLPEVQGLQLDQASPTLTGWLLEAAWALPQADDCLAWDGQMGGWILPGRRKLRGHLAPI